MIAALFAVLTLAGGTVTTGPDWTRVQLGPDHGPNIVAWLTPRGPNILTLPNGLTTDD